MPAVNRLVIITVLGHVDLLRCSQWQMLRRARERRVYSRPGRITCSQRREEAGLLSVVPLRRFRRQLRNKRRSGTIEALPAGASAADVGAKMANAVVRSNALTASNNPVDLASVRRADAARRIGRSKRRDEA